MEKVSASTIKEILLNRADKTTNVINFREFCCELMNDSDDFAETYVKFLLIAIFYALCKSETELFVQIKQLRENLYKIKDDVVAKQTIEMLDACCGCVLKSSPLKSMRATKECKNLICTLRKIKEVGLWPNGKDQKGDDKFIHVSLYN